MPYFARQIKSDRRLVFANRIPFSRTVYPPLVRRHLTFVVSALAIAAASCSGIVQPSETDHSAFVLRPDGIGPFRVGDPFDLVVDGMLAEFGGWDADSADSASPVLVPDCGLPTRMVSWGSLVLLFVGGDGTEAFFTWSYGFDPLTGSADDLRSLGLVTESGVGLGASLADLESAYGPDLDVSYDPGSDLTVFTIDATADEHLEGRFDVPPPDGVVQFIERVPACSNATAG